MPTLEQKPEGDHALSPEEYIRQNFKPGDRLAVVIINRKEGTVTQRVESIETIASASYQAWLRGENARGSDIYISQNSLQETAKGRTKGDIAAIRHVYLDLDNDGPKALAAIESSLHVPTPSYVINSSPGKYQVIWKVDGMNQDQAEALQRVMVKEFGADPAATDSARVLRLPGFFNKKYEQPFRVVAKARSSQTYQLTDFKLSREQAQTMQPVSQTNGVQRAPNQSHRTPSEHDWRWAQDRLRSGESMAVLIQRLEDYRYDKPRPQYYARRTVTRAYARVALSRGDNPDAVMQAIRAYPPNPHENGEQYARQTVHEFMAKLGMANEQQPAVPAHQQRQAQQLGLGVTP